MELFVLRDTILRSFIALYFVCPQRKFITY